MKTAGEHPAVFSFISHGSPIFHSRSSALILANDGKIVCLLNKEIDS
jgi:hypothetical protein